MERDRHDTVPRGSFLSHRDHSTHKHLSRHSPMFDDYGWDDAAALEALDAYERAAPPPRSPLPPMPMQQQSTLLLRYLRLFHLVLLIRLLA